MEKHILICGERGVGKSTLIRRPLAGFAHAILDWATRSVIFYARYRSGKWERMAIRS